ncbi:MAG: type II toxin-antitoxin system VapC family toxin [Tannerellaceae bacterium]|jgi:PIN domain nuclease of toxin-antitoxin system|nr:type II toxin-antitoxin system VapC family toxin [Tannerellaceae bacterium]
MRLLIDTQSFIWFIEADDKLPLSVRNVMEDARNSLAVSIASFWEITIKMSLQKLTLSGSIETMINKALSVGFEILPIESSHLVTLSVLDFFHRDPFDRMIIAQAIDENMGVISSDSIFELYPVHLIWR